MCVRELGSTNDLSAVHSANALISTWVSDLGSVTDVSERHPVNARSPTWVINGRRQHDLLQGSATIERTVANANLFGAALPHASRHVRDKLADEVHHIGLVRLELGNEQAQHNGFNGVWLWAPHEDPRHTLHPPKAPSIEPLFNPEC
jgi:hypothetical protein